MTEQRSSGEGSPGPGEAGEARWVALGRETARTARRVEKLEELVRQLGADVKALAEFVNVASPGPGGNGQAGAAGQNGAGGDGDEVPPPPVVRSWLLTEDPEQAEVDMADLIAWLDRVYLVFPEAQLPSCWLWHPTVVEELWWLRCAHAEAYHPRVGSWLRVGDWHDRQRPGVVHRVKERIETCDLSMHTPEKRHQYRAPQPPRQAPMTSAAAVMAAWMAAGRPAPMPEPTLHQLKAARAWWEAEIARERGDG